MLTSFIDVSRKMNEYEKRFGQLRGLDRTQLTFDNGKLQAIEIKPRQEMQIRGVMQNSRWKNAHW